LNDVVTPLGTPVAENLTLPVKPLTGRTVMAVFVCEDTGMLTLVGDADMVKSGEAAVTVKVTVVECIIPPPEPVTVIGQMPGAVGFFLARANLTGSPST